MPGLDCYIDDDLFECVDIFFTTFRFKSLKESIERRDDPINQFKVIKWFKKYGGQPNIEVNFSDERFHMGGIEL